MPRPSVQAGSGRGETQSSPAEETVAANVQASSSLSTDTPLLADHERMVDRYVRILNAHIESSRHAYLGHNPLQIDFDTTPLGSLGIWTTVQKSQFFASLSRHSRLRPDLIAQDLKRPISEVRMYIDILASGERAVKRTSGGDEGYRDRSARWRSGRTYRTGFAPAAVEVDDAWVQEEEELAMEVERRVEQAESARREREKGERRNQCIKAARDERGVHRVDRKPGVVLSKDVEARLDLESQRLEWGRSLDAGRLETVGRLIDAQDLNDTAYASGSRDARPPPAEKEASEAPASPVKRRQQFTKLERIILDDRAISYLDSLPPREQTKEHLRALRVLVNRRRNRQMQRARVLEKNGMTDAEIRTGGGVDAIFMREAGFDGSSFKVDLELEWGDRWWAVQAGLEGSGAPSNAPENAECNAVNGGEDQGKHREAGEEASQAGAGDKLGIGSLAREKGWDVFDYRTMAKLLKSAESSTSLSFQLLDILLRELRAYLTEVIYQIITLAEQDKHQWGPLAVSPSDLDGHTDWISRSHVEMVLCARDEIRITQTDLSSASREEREYLESLLPPTRSPWGELTLRPLEVEETAEEEGEDGDEDDVKSTITDAEDLELDDALELADAAMDREIGRRLREKGVVPGEKGRKRKRFFGQEGDEIDSLNLPERTAYETLHTGIMRKRRWRRAVASRSSGRKSHEERCDSVRRTRKIFKRDAKGKVWMDVVIRDDSESEISESYISNSGDEEQVELRDESTVAASSDEDERGAGEKEGAEDEKDDEHDEGDEHDGGDEADTTDDGSEDDEDGGIRERAGAE